MIEELKISNFRRYKDTTIRFNGTSILVEKIMQENPHHNYQILTKRAERMAEYFATRNIPQNVWIGVTVECKGTKTRIDFIRNLDASVKFLSCEPLLEDLDDLNLQGINWIIVGGESGVQARPMKEEWVLI